MNYIKKYWKHFVAIILAIVLLYGIVYLATPKPQMSELDKYKLEQLDQNIQKLQKLQQSLNDSLNVYQKKIDQIDERIGNIKVERKEVNNLYTPTRFRTMALDSKPDYTHHVQVSLSPLRKRQMLFDNSSLTP